MDKDQSDRQDEEDRFADECSVGIFHTFYPDRDGRMSCSKCGQHQ